MVIGAQLYTVREFTKNLNDFEATLKKITDMGCKVVQVSGSCDFEAQWLAEQEKKLGFSCVLTHTKAPEILGNTDKVCRDHGVFQCKNIGLGAVPGGKLNDEIYENFVRDFKPAAERIKENGYRFFYHNHAFEFCRGADGERFFEKILRDFPADLMGITFDTYWAQFAGMDPAKVLLQLKDRVECMHLKDMCPTDRNGNHMAPVGYGNMDFERIIESAEKAGAEYLLVEQDDCYGEDPFVCLNKSFGYLKSLGLDF